MKKFHFTKNYAFFIGALADNKFHKHYAQQISVTSNLQMALTQENGHEHNGQVFFINSQVIHKLESVTEQLTLLINPVSSIGHQLHINFSGNEFMLRENELSIVLTNQLDLFQKNEIGFEILCSKIDEAFFDFKCKCEKTIHINDNRILRAIEYMDKHFETPLNVEQVAELCFLSPTRFLHLFKEKTNLNFRRYQLWNKLVLSLPYLMDNTVVDTAYKFGFSDNSHYTRTFKETFGVTPKFLSAKR